MDSERPVKIELEVDPGLVRRESDEALATEIGERVVVELRRVIDERDQRSNGATA